MADSTATKAPPPPGSPSSASKSPPLRERIMDGSRVARAVYADWNHQATQRQVRAFIMREFAGPWYSQCHEDLEGRDDLTKRPVSFLKRLVDTYLPNLVGTEIHAKVTAKRAGLGGAARLRELVLDYWAECTNLARTHRLVVMDAMLGGLGLYRVGLKAGADITKVAGNEYDIGQPYACRVDPDDFARDRISRDPDEDTRRAIRYRVSKQLLLDMNIYDSEAVEAIPTLRNYSPMSSDSAQITMGSNDGSEGIDDQVELWDVFFYLGDKVLVGTLPTIGTNAGKNGWLSPPQEYVGPGRGPLIEMRLRDLPNNTQPVSIAAQNLDLHLGEAMLATKAMRRMLAQCRKIFYKPEESDQMLEINNGVDDEALPGEYNGQQADLGGIDESTLKGLEQVTTWGNNETANLQQTGGNFDPNVKTATVGSIQQGNAQVKLSDMRNMANEPLKCVMQIWGSYIDSDQNLVKQFSIRAPGGGMVDVEYNAQRRKGSYADFDFDVQAVSEEPTDPRQKKAEFAQFMQWSIQWLAGVAQLGGNVEAGVRLLSDKYNTPELDEVFPTQGGMQMAAAQQQAKALTTPQPTPAKNPKPGQQRTQIQQRQADVAQQPAGAM